jgi:F-type H+-transporting ATPase subunit b
MKNREKRIFERLMQADDKEKLFQAELKRLEKKLKDVKDQKAEVLAKAKEEGEHIKAEMLKEAHKEIKEKQLKFERQIEKEKNTLYNTVSELVAQILVKETKAAFKELANKDLENEIAEVFADKIDELPKNDIEIMKDSTEKSKELIIAGAFDFNKPTKDKIEKALKSTVPGSYNIVYKTDPSIICGIEIISNDTIIRWGLAKYIEAFNKGLQNAINKITPFSPEAKE